MPRIDYKNLTATYKYDDPKIVFKIIGDDKNLKWVAENDEELFYPFHIPFIDDDWVIYIKKSKKIKLKHLTEKQFEEWKANVCYRKQPCSNCPFLKIDCDSSKWVQNKHLYSRYFLNQKIDIDKY